MIPYEEALARIVQAFSPVSAEQVAVSEAAGRVLARDVSSRVTQPPADVSSMDGYAVRSVDTSTPPTALRVIGESAAGAGFDGHVGPRDAVRIFTGAPVPAGADAVVMQENTDRKDKTITVNVAAAVGAYIRPTGMDFAEGQVLLEAGKVLSCRDAALAAAMNVPWVMVRRLPRIAVLATGDELAMPGEPLGPDAIVSSNSVGLASWVRQNGGEPVNLGIARDNEESLNAMLDGARGVDALVTIGGASVGDHDLVGRVLGERGMDLDFWKVAMRPGKPLIFGRLGDIPVIGLPGNPVSAGVTAELFLGPAMRAMLGAPAKLKLEKATLGRGVGLNDERQDFLRGTISVTDKGHLTATPFERQDSALLTLFAKAECLIIRPPHAPAAKKGDPVDVLLLP